MFVHEHACICVLYNTASSWRRYKTNFAALESAWTVLVLDTDTLRSLSSTVELWQLKISMQDEKGCAAYDVNCPLQRTCPGDKQQIRQTAIEEWFVLPQIQICKPMMHSCPRCGLYRFGFRINPTTSWNVGSCLAATTAAGASGVHLILAAASGGSLVIEPLVVLLETGHDA